MNPKTFLKQLTVVVGALVVYDLAVKPMIQNIRPQ